MAKNLISSPTLTGLAKSFVSFTSTDVRHCRKLSSYSISRKTYDSNSTKWQKTLILGLIESLFQSNSD